MDNKLLQPGAADMDSSSTTDSAVVKTPGTRSSVSGESKSHWGGTAVKALLIVLAFGAGWMAANARHENQQREGLPSDVTHGDRTPSAVIVTVEPVTHRPVQRIVEVLGTLHGFEEVSISARIEGRVHKVFHDVSDRVKPDELLLDIDPTDYDLSVQQSDRALQVELAKLGLKEPPDTTLDLKKVPAVAKAKAAMEHARSRHERLSKLAATKTVSAEDSESAASDYRTTLAEYDNQIIQAEAAVATIQMKQVELLVSRENLAHTKISVPTPTVAIPGTSEMTYVVSQRSVSEGTLVRPGTELFRLVISQTLKLRVPVPERYSSEVHLNQQVQVFAAASTTPYGGTVTRIYPTVEPTTRTFQVEIQVPNPNGDLKPGSFAKASILTRIDSKAATVPLSALVQFAGITKIFLAEQGKANEVPVILGTQTTEWVEIVKPALADDAVVITSGQTTIANASPIAVREEATKLGESSMKPDPGGTNGANEPQLRGHHE